MGAAPSSPKEEFADDDKILTSSSGRGGQAPNRIQLDTTLEAATNAVSSSSEGEFADFTLSNNSSNTTARAAPQLNNAETPKGCGVSPSGASAPSRRVFERRRKSEDFSAVNDANEALIRSGKACCLGADDVRHDGELATEGEIISLDSIQPTLLEDVDENDGGAVAADSFVRSTNPSLVVSTMKADGSSCNLSPISRDLEAPAPVKLLSHSWHGDGGGGTAAADGKASLSPHSGKQSLISAEHRSDLGPEEVLDVEDF